MFGTYRTFLALIVVVHHLISIPVIGHYAIHGFFILSGYLMTLIMVNTYGYSFQGFRSFAVNRFLRLYPSYWIVLCFTLLAIAYYGEENATQYREFIFFPDSISNLIQNFTLIFFDLFPNQVSPRLSPPTWALTIELLFYLLIALGISKSRTSTAIWFVCSLLYMISTHILNLDYSYRYSIIIAGTLPFSIGAMIFHFHPSLNFSTLKKSRPLVFSVLLLLFTLNCLFGVAHYKSGLPSYGTTLSFYANYLLNALIIVYLINVKTPLISPALDSKIGDYSYPIYLMHWQTGFIASMLVWSSPIRGNSIEGVVSLIVALLLCFFLSWLIIRYIDRPIERLRTQIKKKSSL